MKNFIDIGIDFGAENIVAVAIGYDKLGRSDYKLLPLDSNGTVKNYLAQRKVDKGIELGSEVKIAYVNKSSNSSEYDWVCGRYKGYILEKEKPAFEVPPEELLKLGLAQIIKKIENFDFSPLLSGKLRNLSVGIPQSWGVDKKLLYKNILAEYWNHGKISLVSEPVAATIAAYKRSLVELSDNTIMILDIGASTFDISFSRYDFSSKKLDIFDLTYRSEYAGHFFDTVLAAFTLMSEVNRNASLELIDRVNRLRLRKVEDYIKYISSQQQKYSLLLLELENIKEQHLAEIFKFNRKKLIDLNQKTHLVINKTIYQNALKYYSEKLSSDITRIIQEFKNTKYYKTNNIITPFLCGGASSLFGLERDLRDSLPLKESKNLFSITKEGLGNKIDTTIAIGLAHYAQDNNILASRTNHGLAISLKTENEEKKKLFWICHKNDFYPFEAPKTLSSILGLDSELEFQKDSEENISLLLFKVTDPVNAPQEVKMIFEIPETEVGDKFDINFSLEIDDIWLIEIVNLSKNLRQKKYLA